MPRGDHDLAIVIGDGLSATAVQAHAAAVVTALRARLSGWGIAPLVIARQARVAIGDPIGEALGAKAVVVLIGERPGLSAADSLGAYITWRPGRAAATASATVSRTSARPAGFRPNRPPTRSPGCCRRRAASV